MLHAMRTASTGMFSQQKNIDTIAHNLANVNTAGFKKGKIEFQDLLYQTLREAGGGEGEPPAPIQIGNGVRIAASQRMFTQGDVFETGNPLDLMIEGDGFFQVSRPDGSIAYSRDGSFKLSADGQIVTSMGYALEPDLTLPSDTSGIMVTPDGIVYAQIANETEPVEAGELTLVRFINPGGLESIGGNLFLQTQASGSPLLGAPGEEGLGILHPGYLEASNVSVVEEMVNMILAQRAYEISSKAIQTSDEMLSIANNLRR